MTRIRTGLWIAVPILVIAACQHNAAPADPAPTAKQMPIAPPSPSPLPANPGPPQGGPPVGRGRTPPPSAASLDSARAGIVADIMKTIAGRENEPAGTVFKNVKINPDMPAGRFLTAMNTDYGRGLGWACTNCHTVGQWDSDSKKDKNTAREMAQVTRDLNKIAMPAVKGLAGDFHTITCVMCHRGSNEPPSNMAVPGVVPTPGPRPGGH